MVSGGDLEDLELDPDKALEGTRHLVLFDISRRLLLVEQELGFCDSECDRALGEVRRLLRWVEGRVTRNGAFSSAPPAADQINEHLLYSDG